MANEPTLVTEKRTELGTAECRRLRKRGIVPGNVYGHNQDPVAISTSAESLNSIVLAGTRVVDFNLGGAVEKAMFREVQWDTFGTHIQHFDLVRIRADERVTVEVPIELRGMAPGTTAGGVLDQQLRSLTVECLAFEIPDSIAVRIGALEVGQAIHVSDVELPADINLHNPPEAVVVQVVQAAEEELEEAEAVEVSVEPEVIGRKAGPESEDLQE